MMRSLKYARFGNPAAVSPPAFDPSSLAPALWLKSDVGLYQERTGVSATTLAAADGDPVGTWLDQSGNGRHFIAASDPGRPVLKLAIQAGRPVVRFNGSSAFLKNDAVASLFSGVAAPVSIFFVYKSANQASALVGVGYSIDDTNLCEIRPRHSDAQQFFRRTIAGSLSSFGSAMNTSWHVQGYLFDSAGILFSLDGTTVFEAASSAQSISLDLCTIGAQRRSSTTTGELFVSGDVGEILFFNSVLAG